MRQAKTYTLLVARSTESTLSVDNRAQQSNARASFLALGVAAASLAVLFLTARAGWGPFGYLAGALLGMASGAVAIGQLSLRSEDEA